MNSRSDLHIHSRFSDGEDTIEEIIDKLKSINIKVFSITDHDNIDSCIYLKDKKSNGIKYIPGVEISSYYKRMGIHILGYYIDSDNKKLIKLLDRINNKRKKRMKEILKKLKIRSGVTLSNDDFDILMNGKSIGKKALSKILVKEKLGNDYKEIRDNYLSNMKCKVSYRSSIKKVCKIIKLSNGISILAHPKEMEVRYKIKLEDVIEDLIKYGINGIEVYHSIHSKEDINRYLKNANKYNLLISGGSDYHSSLKNNIGKLSKDNIEIDYNSINIIDIN